MNAASAHITYINNNLALSSTLLKEAGVSVNTIKRASTRGTQGWHFHKLPGVKPLFVEWEPLKDTYKKQVENHLKCSPEQRLFQEQILAHLKPDHEAVAFFNTHRTACGDFLDDQLKEKYVTVAQWLNLLDGLVNKKLRINKGLLHSLRADRWAALRTIMKQQQVALPFAYCKLMEKLRVYIRDNKRNYKAIINGRVNNQNARKVQEGICLDLLLEMISHHKQFDCPEICQAYNTWAKKNGFKTITRSTVNYYWQKYDQEVTAFRDGEHQYHIKIDKVIHRRRPDRPLYLINHDDNDLDLHFYEFTPGEGSTYTRRFVLIVLKDAYNDYPLGYSYSLGAPTVELIKAAYLDAVHHIHDLTGEWALWHETKADRFAFKALKPWIEQHAHFTPARAKVARSKVIEQSFGHWWHKYLKRYDNYTGHNITARKRGINPDFVQRAKKEYPEANIGPEQIAHFMEQLRTRKGQTGKSLQQQWLDAFRAMPDSEKRIMTHEERLMWFGLLHNEKNRLRNTGIQTRLMGGRTYDVAGEDYQKHIGKQFQLIYDPYMPEMALVVADEGRVRLLVREYDKVPMDIKSRKNGDGLRIAWRLKEKREMNRWVIDRKDRRRENVENNAISVNGLLQGTEWTKEIKMEAERRYLADEVFQLNQQQKEQKRENTQPRSRQWDDPEARALEDF